MENEATESTALVAPILDESRAFLIYECAKLGMTFEKSAVLAGLSPEEEAAVRADPVIMRTFTFHSSYREKELRELLFDIAGRNARKGNSTEVRDILDRLEKLSAKGASLDIPLEGAQVVVVLPDNARGS